MAVHPHKAGTFYYVLTEPLRILYVDDDPILREFAVVNLSTEEAVVETACDGQMALGAIEAAKPDIVLLDLEMPNLDGFGVLQFLRADPRYADLPVIVVTSREDVDAIDRAFQAGANSFIVKPLNWRLLSHQIRYVHRSALTEQRLTRSDSDSAARLRSLVAAGARFISEALAREPALSTAAAPFARALDGALSLREGEAKSEAA